MIRTISAFLLTFAVQAKALDPELLSKGEEAFSTDFKAGLPKGWRAQFGHWSASGGVLKANQIPADNHAAAARQVLEMQDGIFQLRFRFVRAGKGFHFGFDPKRGTLKKKGHLFSVIVSPALVKITKHVDKNNREGDPNEDLAKVEHQFKPGVWHTLMLEKRGNNVLAQIKGSASAQTIKLKAAHDTFHVPTPTLVFRCIGDGIEIAEVKVWRAE